VFGKYDGSSSRSHPLRIKYSKDFNSSSPLISLRFTQSAANNSLNFSSFVKSGNLAIEMQYSR
jgi:hypothetical protein